MKNRKILENLIYLAIFLIPLYLVRIKIGFLPTNAWEIIIAGIFLLWFFSDKGKKISGEFFKKYKKYIGATSLIFVGILTVTFFSGNSTVSWGIIKGWFLVPILFLFLVGKIIPKEKLTNVFSVYFFSAVGVAIVSLGYYGLGFLTYDGRLAGIFNSPNYLAMYLAPAIIIVLEQIKVEKNKNYAIGFGWIIILGTFYLTYSYAGWSSVAVSYIILSLIKNKIEMKKIILVMIIIFVFLLSQWNSKKMTDLLFSDTRSSLASRVMIWKASTKMLENNFIFGIGPGNFQKKYLEYQKFYPPYLEWAVPHPNNLYLAFWLSGGILGLVGFLSLVFFWLKDIFVKIKTESNEILFITLGIMLIILLHGIFDTTYFKNDLAIIFWLNFLVLKD